MWIESERERERDKTVDHISECNKLPLNEYRSKSNWVGKVIYCELCKRMEFEHT